jgi:hypothetical protein
MPESGRHPRIARSTVVLSTLSAALTDVDWGDVARGAGIIALALLDGLF